MCRGARTTQTTPDGAGGIPVITVQCPRCGGTNYEELFAPRMRKAQIAWQFMCDDCACIFDVYYLPAAVRVAYDGMVGAAH